MRIGKVAQLAEVSVQTVRFYERRGLIKQPRRLESGYRDYPPETAAIIQFIRKNQRIGFTLNEIRSLLTTLAGSKPASLNRRADIQKKIQALDQQILFLKSVRDDLESCLEACVCSDGMSPCPEAQLIAGFLR